MVWRALQVMRVNSLFNKQAQKVLKNTGAAVSFSFECKFLMMIQVNLKYGMLFI